MFSSFFVEAGNHRAINFSMLVVFGADNHYICPELQPNINQYIRGVVLLEKLFPIRTVIGTASDEVGYATASGVI